MTFLHQAALYLGAVVITVSLFKRLGLGSVLGYLCAGVLLGPDGFNRVGDVEAVMHFGELGVIFLLFILGLELQPRRLWDLRVRVFGLGGAQVAATTCLIALGAIACGLDWQTSILVGVGLSLSSTAFALQLLGERSMLGRPHGQAAFAVLLFQDIATIVLLAAMPLLSGGLEGQASSLAITAAKTGGVLALLVASQHLLKPALKFIASQHVHELFTAASLLVVLAFALVVDAIGLSMALGAFLAGMLFADSEYRHALEADIEPFKGLLLGLFFMAVGMSVQLELLAERPVTLLMLVVALMSTKAAVLWALGRYSFGRGDEAIRLALTIGQGGEFAFVIFGQAVGRGAMPQALCDLLIAVVTLSMAATPLLLTAYERSGLGKKKRKKSRRASAYDVAPEEDPRVIIAGFGRMGQMAGRIFKAMGIPFTALDTNPEHIDFIKKFGNKVFYGDAARPDMLRAARAEQAKVFVLSISDPERSLRCAESVLAQFPHLKMVARARNRDHAYRLRKLGVPLVVRETFFSSLVMARQVLTELGLTFTEVQSAIERFQEHDENLLEKTFPYADDPERLRAAATEARRELRSLFESLDAPNGDDEADGGEAGKAADAAADNDPTSEITPPSG